MKELKVVLLGLIIVSSCTQNTLNDDSISVDKTISQTENVDNIKEMLASFPLKWIHVEIENRNTVIVENCDIPTAMLTIENKGDYFIIKTVYGNDFEEWELISMTATEQMVEGQEVQDGLFLVKKMTYPDGEVYESSYFWNKTSGYCYFRDFYKADVAFADYSKKDAFKLKVVPCN